MIILNLIAPKQKKELRLFFFYYLLKNGVFMILICIILSAVVLLITRMVLRKNFIEVVEQTSLVHQNVQLFNQETAGLNHLLQQATTVQNDYTPWSNILIYLNQLMPKDLQVYNLTIKPAAENKTANPASPINGWQILIQGQAKTRGDILTLKDRLTNSLIFTNIQSPLANILQQTNVNFELTAILPIANLARLTKELIATQPEISWPAPIVNQPVGSSTASSTAPLTLPTSVNSDNPSTTQPIVEIIHY